MKLEAKELRIGNWVLDEDSEEVQIEHLQPIFGYAFRWEWLKHYKPIPLTEDSLLKFGFEKSGDWFFRRGVNSPCLNISLIHKKTTIGDNEEYEVKHIGFVHSLQNFLYSVGEELEIKHPSD